MDTWLHIALRQLILYSLPVVISLSAAGLMEALCLPRQKRPHAFFALAWHGAWLPLAAAIAMGRAFIIALPRPLATGFRAAASRLAAHALLCLIGFMLYAWSLNQQPPAGLPPLHHWWAKVLMFFNLCMLALHLLPLPGQWLGEYLLATPLARTLRPRLTDGVVAGLYALIAASPLLDLLLGRYVIFPLYGHMASAAARLAG